MEWKHSTFIQKLQKTKSVRVSFLRRITTDECQVTEFGLQFLQETEILKQQNFGTEKKLDEKAEEVFDLLNEGMEQKHKIHKSQEAMYGIKNRGKLIHEVGMAKNIVNSTILGNIA